MDDLLEKKGLKREDIWSRAHSRMMRRAKYELMRLGGLSAAFYGVCSALAKKPEEHAGNANFGRALPRHLVRPDELELIGEDFSLQSLALEQTW